MNTKRAAIFAHFDKDNLIDDYVIFYLNELKRVSDRIIFVSSCNLLPAETDKISGICDAIISEKHDEYDFGSYKRGFFAPENIENYDEIIFANDSCYGPFFPLDEIFAKMNGKKCDFWGITENKVDLKGKSNPHIQTYFFVINKKIAGDKDFAEFLKHVKSQTNKNEIINNYEIKLSELLHQKGYSSKVYVQKYNDYRNPAVSKWRELFVQKLSPFVKCSVLKLQNTQQTTIQNWQEIFNENQYRLISKHLKRFNLRCIKNKVSFEVKAKFFNLINNLKMPHVLNKIILKITQKIIPNLFD